MNFVTIEQALGMQLVGMAPSYPVAWPNKDYDPKGALPYIEFRHVPASVTDDSIDASMHVQTGLALITVVVSRDGFSTDANDIAQAVADRFPMGTRIPAGDGSVMITKPPEPVAGFTDGIYYRLPVRVNYRTAPPIA